MTSSAAATGDRPELERVDWALMLPGAEPVGERSINTVWNGEIMLSDDTETSAFIKVLPNRDLFIECACSILGRQLGLRIPRPFIVLPDQQAIDERGLGAESLAFGCEDAEHPSFTKFLNGGDSDSELWKRIESSGTALSCGVFDEWIGNSDRHSDNILYSGGDDFWLIDHETAIPDFTVPTSAVDSNQILENTYCKKSELERRRFIKTAERRCLPSYSQLNLAVLSDKVSGSDYLDAKSIQQIVDYLNVRTIPILAQLIKERVVLTQKELPLHESAAK